MVGSEQHFRDSLGVDGATALLVPLEQGCEAARQIAVAHGFVEGRTEPTVAFDLSVKALGDLDELLPGVRRVCSKGQHLWILDDTYAIRVKKLGAGYRPANHISGQQRRIANFLPLDGMEPLIYVTAGVRYSTVTGLPVEFVVVKHFPGRHGKQRVEWVVDLQDLAGGQTAAASPVLGLPGAPATPAAIRRRRNRADEAAES